MIAFRNYRARRVLNAAIKAGDWLLVGLLKGGGVRLR